MWYSASLLMKGISPTRKVVDTLWEETIVLIEADSLAEAAAKAQPMALAAESEYVCASGESITWRFDRIERVYEIGEELCVGTELFSRLLRNSEVDSLLTPFPDE